MVNGPAGEPLFKAVFGSQWEALPPVMKKHYAIRPYSDDVVKVEGTLDVSISPLVSLMARLTGMLLAHSGRDVPVTVVFRSGRQSGAFHLERTFHFPDRGDVMFRSRMEVIEGNELVEFMRFGIGWKLAYVRIPPHAGHRFQRMPVQDSRPCRATLPGHAGRGCDAG